jgi:hypothetical protein
VTGQESDTTSRSAHPDDVDNLHRVKLELVQALSARLGTGLSITFISRSLGHRHEYMNQVMDPYVRPELGFPYDTFVDLAEGCMTIPRLDLFGADGVTTPMWEMARDNHGLLAVGALSVMRKVREDRGLSAQQVADRLGMHKSWVQRTEDADNPYMGRVQHLARGLDMIVRFRVVRTWTNGGMRQEWSRR